MRKLLLPIMISSFLISSVANAATEQEVKDVINKNESVLFADQKAKEWGDTPDFVKLLASRINVKNKDEGLSPFNIFWLEKVNQDPKTYQLSQEDQKWISDKIEEAKNNKSSFWYPNGLSIAENSSIPVKEPVKESPPSIPSTEEKQITTSDKNVPVTKENDNSSLTEKKPLDLKVEENKSITSPVVNKESEKMLNPPTVAPDNTEKSLSWGEDKNIENKSVSDEKPSLPPKEKEEVKVSKKETEVKKPIVDKKESSDLKNETSLPLEKATVSKNKADFVKKQNTVKNDNIKESEKNNDAVVSQSKISENTVKATDLNDDNKVNAFWYFIVLSKLVILSFLSAVTYSLVSRKKIKNK